MKFLGWSASVVIVALAAGAAASPEAAPPTLKGDYMGQHPPGLTPEVFAPGVVSTKEWGDAGRFSLDMKEFHVSRWRMVGDEVERVSTLFVRSDDTWKEMTVSGEHRVPFFSPDGNALYFGKRFKARTDTGWSELQSIGSAFEDYRIMSLSVSAKGTYAFDEVGTNGNGVIRYSRLIDGKREEPQSFGAEINTGTWNAHPFIAPDESFILWDGERASGYGSSDIYISFREDDGSWSDAINLGNKVNTTAEEGGVK